MLNRKIPEELREILEELYRKSNKIGQKINPNKPKVMWETDPYITIGDP